MILLLAVIFVFLTGDRDFTLTRLSLYSSQFRYTLIANPFGNYSSIGFSIDTPDKFLETLLVRLNYVDSLIEMAPLCIFPFTSSILRYLLSCCAELSRELVLGF